MRHGWRWSAALREHESVVREFLAACGRIAPEYWQRAPVPGKWTAAAVVLHVCRAYELGRDAAAGGESMRLKVSPSAALISRMLILPVVLATHRFPRGARSPREVVPDAGRPACSCRMSGSAVSTRRRNRPQRSCAKPPRAARYRE